MLRPRDPKEPKIYLVPNMMTAGNLGCGFFAVLTIFQGILQATSSEMNYNFDAAQPYYERAILLILAACAFDLLDGRLARLGGRESPFGREFDSLADVISFGMAPSLLMAKAVLFPLDELLQGLGWYLACFYVVCGAIRLARFNCLAALPGDGPEDSDFRGIPIPMAAGFISSLTYLIIFLNENDRDLGWWKYVLAGAMLALSVLMISDVRYPSFKKIGWRTRGTPVAILSVLMLVVITVRNHHVMPVVLFSSYLLYGLLIRPFLSKKTRRELEDVGAYEEETAEGKNGPTQQ